MKAKRPFLALFGAAIALIAVLALPSLAQAHPGHHEPSISISMSATDADIVAADVQTSQYTASISADAGKVKDFCGGILCCGNAPCAACFFIIAPLPTTLDPLASGADCPMIERSVPPSFGQNDLSRPPRSFV